MLYGAIAIAQAKIVNSLIHSCQCSDRSDQQKNLDVTVKTDKYFTVSVQDLPNNVTVRCRRKLLIPGTKYTAHRDTASFVVLM
jgi:hypothetical protein